MRQNIGYIINEDIQNPDNTIVAVFPRQYYVAVFIADSEKAAG
jgi:hypothetical protein